MPDGGVGRRRGIRRRREVVDMDELLREPLRVRMSRGQLGLDLFVVDDAAFSRVDQKNPPWA